MCKQFYLLCVPSLHLGKHKHRCYLVIRNLTLLILYLACTVHAKSLANFFDTHVADSVLFSQSGFNYLEGDYRPLMANCSFSQGGSAPYYWEVFVAGSWEPTSVAPEVYKPLRIVINQKAINAGASSSNSYNDIVVVDKGELIISEDATNPSQNFINAGSMLDVENGGKLFIEGDIKMQKSTFLIIRAGGAMIIDQNSISNAHAMWGGAEMFEDGSKVTIKNWKWNAPAPERSLIENADAISNNLHGYKFGNLMLDINPTSLWTIISGATGMIDLCEDDFEINNLSPYFITGASNENGINGFRINGNMTISNGAFSFGSSYSAADFSHQFIINGTFECKSSSVLKIHHTIALTPATLNGFVTFKNNVTIASTVSSFTNDAASTTILLGKRMFINFDGGTTESPLLLDIAPTIFAISINIKSGAFVQLTGHDIDTKTSTGNTAIFTVENLATLNFGWAPDGITPLVIKKSTSGGGPNKFASQSGSILKITSEDGLQDALTTGNVQYVASNKSYSTSATFWYIGKANQITGDCLGSSGTGRQVIIEMANNSLSTTLTQSFSLTNSTTVSPTGGKLDIRRGQFLETPTAFVEGVTNENSSGTLYMSPGTLYRISSLSTASVQPNIPRMAGVKFPYQLSGGTIELSADGDQALRGNKDYRNLTFSNSGIKTISSAPTSVTGTILIKDDAVLDVGVDRMGGAGTDFTMEGNSKYITAGVLTKPDAQGTYNLGPRTTIEFTNSNNLTMQDIRLGLSTENPVTYNNIIISGNNVGNSSLSSTPVTMQSGSTFTVTATGIFKHKNANGFSGASNTCITNMPVVVLEDGSTIEYNRDNGTNQNISNQHPYKNLVLSGSGTKTAPAGNLIVLGDLTKKGAAVFQQPGGSVVLEGNTTQTIISNSPEILFNNLVNKNTVGVFINNDVAVYKEVLFAPASKIILNTGNVILKSDAVNTASVAKIPTNALISYNTGLFVVERYINTGLAVNGQHAKSWQFVSTPAFGESVVTTWQENKAALNTYGTWITGGDLSNWSAQGFDAYSPAPSMKTYDAATNRWIGISSTSISLAAAEGYMLFVRGDRTVTAVNQAAKPCILRTKGKLYGPFAGYTPPQISIRPHSYQSIGNPYASRIDLEYMFDNGLMNGIDESFYVWDPLLTGSYGLGGYQTISKNLGYKPVPGAPGNPTQYYDPSVKSNYVESGQAFFVHNSSALDGTVTFNEDCKASGSRLVNKEHDADVKNQIIRAYLFTENRRMADGNAVIFGDDFSNSVDRDDALKILNSGENFGLLRNENNLAVEARKRVSDNDTIFFQTQNLTPQTYYLQFMFENMQKSVDAFLVDQFLQTTTLLNMEDSALHSFGVNNELNSSRRDRFMILLKKKVILPVTFTSVTAYIQNKSIVVKWQVENEADLVGYSIEKSMDAINFVQAGNQSAENAHTYQWKDVNAVEGYNYYRIKSKSLNGEIKFSEVVSAHITGTSQSITVYPNPIRDGIVHLHFGSQPPATYQVRIFNSSGELLVSKTIDHTGGDLHENIPLQKHTASGIYWLEISKPGAEKSILRIRIN